MTRHDPAAKRHGHVKVSSLAIATEAIVGSSILCLPVLFQQEKIRQNAEQKNRLPPAKKQQMSTNAVFSC